MARRSGRLTIAVRASVRAMPWLGASDQALVRLAELYAQRLDEAADVAAAVGELPTLSPDDDLYDRVRKLEAAADHTKAVGWLGPHLQNTLKALGGAPIERLQLAPPSTRPGRLAELREQRDAATG